jgi:hypothetical protein
VQQLVYFLIGKKCRNGENLRGKKKVPEDKRDTAFRKTGGRTTTSDLRNLDIFFFVGASCHIVLKL